MARYKFDIAPSTDEQPYFFDFFKWRTLPELMVIRRAGGAGLLELGNLILVATLVQATLLSAVLIMAPLWTKRRVFARSSQIWRVATYFFALGLGFLFVEIAFIQKFILFLGHPLYAVAVVLTGFLLFAGVGSAASSWFDERIDAWQRANPDRGLRLSAIQLSVVGIVAVSLLYLLILPAPVQFAAIPYRYRQDPGLARPDRSTGLLHGYAVSAWTVANGVGGADPRSVGLGRERLRLGPGCHARLTDRHDIGFFVGRAGGEPPLRGCRSDLAAAS